MDCHLQNLSFSKKNYLYHEPYKQSVVVFCFVSMDRYILIMYSIELLFHCLIIKCRRIIGFQSAHYSFYARFGHGSNTFSPFWQLLNVFMFMFGPTYDDFSCIIYNMYKSITPVEKSRFPKFWTLYNRWFKVIIINYINVTSNDVNARVVAISMTMNLISGDLTCPNATWKTNDTHIAMVALCCLIY